MISKPFVHRMAIFALRKMRSKDSEGRKKSCEQQRSGGFHAKRIDRHTLYTRNHSDRCGRRPRREPKEAGALALSLILPTTGSSTRKTLSSYRTCGQKASIHRTCITSLTYILFFHINNQGSSTQTADAEEMNVFRAIEFLGCL
jgi:hypothetical protein